MNTRTDAELLEALRRAWLIPSSGAEEEDTGKFNLDTVVSDEGLFFHFLKRIESLRRLIERVEF